MIEKQIILELLKNGPTLSSDVWEACEQRGGNARRALRELKEDGLIERTTYLHDTRKKIWRLKR